MINYIDIENNILIIEGKYVDPLTTTHEQILYSKLAVLEFCGWIEESLDQILKDYLHLRITTQNQTYVDKNIIKNNYGFEYERYTRRMFCSVLGIKNLETVETTLNGYGGQIITLESILLSYTRIRNNAAHNSTPVGTTLRFNAPSIVLSHFRTIKPIISDLETTVSCLP
ncbi:MAG TPA: hypothetical protein DHV48_19800 [Prolixibacteraceae bacterium]|nr:hypothetical protein [Prolixibacteraceae bacterium]